MLNEVSGFLEEKRNGTAIAVGAFGIVAMAILFAFYYPLLAEHYCFYASDHCYYFEPFAHFIADAYRNLRIPLWNPYVYSGMPQVAVPSPGIFYPFNLIWVFLSYGQGLGIILLLHQLIAGVGAFLLISRLGWGAGAAFLAGSTCAFCGYMFSLHTNHTLITSASWIPLSVWAMLALKQASGTRELALRVVIASITIFLLITAGRPEVSAAGLTLIFLFSLIQSAFPNLSKQALVGSNFAWQLAAFAIAALLTMPLVLPTLEWLSLSPRAQGMDVKFVFLWSANWYDLLSSVFAQPFGDLQTLGSQFLDIAASRPHFIPFLASPLIGPVVVTLAIWGLSDRSWHARAWIVVLTTLTLLMIIGEYTILIPKIVALIPCATLLRYPIKLTVIVSFCFALMAARGLYALTSDNMTKGSLKLTVILWTVSLLTGLTVFYCALFGKPIPFPVLANNSEAQLLIGVAVILGSVGGFLTTLCGWLVRRKTWPSSVGAIALNALLILSLTLPAYCYRPRVAPDDFFTAHPYLLDRLQSLGWKSDPNFNLRILLLYGEPVQEPTKYAWKANSSFNQNYYQYTRQILLPLTNLDNDVPATFGYEAAATADYYDQAVRFIHLAANAPDENDPYLKNLGKGETSESRELSLRHIHNLPLAQFCRSSGTGFVCGQAYGGEEDLPLLDPALFDLVLEDRVMDMRVYRVRDALPRAFVAHSWHWMNTHKEALRAVSVPKLTHFDPAKVLVERLPKDGPSYVIPLPAGCFIGSAADKPGNVNLDIDRDGAVWTQSGYMTPAGKSSHNTLERAPEEQAPVFLRSTPEHISLSLKLINPSFLVLSDQFYPGWKAKIDGIDSPIFRANGLFRAVYATGGAHLIQFDYEPDSLAFGAWCAALGISIDLWLLILVVGPSVLRAFKRMAGQDI
jgi:hypothetical protein